MDKQSLAEACVAAMYERDAGSQSLGMKVEKAGPGISIVSMPVRSDMVNGHGSCHGGFIFSLADSAFAFACNSANRVNVAMSCSIDYLSPAFLDDRLTADARVLHASGRTGLTEIDIFNQHNELIARFRGRSFQKNEPVIREAQ
jgi:acyl-CoA thioesterase